MDTQMQEPNDGGSAFPAMLPGGNYCTQGMTLRDWFAGQALAAIITSEVNETAHGDSADAYMYADAMLAARDRDTTTAHQIALGIGGGK